MGAFYQNLKNAKKRRSIVHWSSFVIITLGCALPFLGFLNFGLYHLGVILAIVSLIAASALELIWGRWPQSVKNCPECGESLVVFGIVQINEKQPECMHCSLDLRNR